MPTGELQLSWHRPPSVVQDAVRPLFSLPFHVGELWLTRKQPVSVYQPGTGQEQASGEAPPEAETYAPIGDASDGDEDDDDEEQDRSWKR